MVSFRWRLLGVSAAVVTGAVAAVMALAWASLEGIERERLDARLCPEARRLATQRFRPEEADRLESDLRGKLRLPPSARLVAWTRWPDGQAGIRVPEDGAELPDDSRLAWAPGPGKGESPPSKGEPPPEEAGPGGPPDRGGKGERRKGPERPPRARCDLGNVPMAGEDLRVARVRLPFAAGYVATEARTATAELEGELAGVAVRVAPIALALVALGALLLSAIAMRPLSRLRDAMGALTPSKLDQRLPDAGEDREFADLIAAYNAMLGRLEASFSQASRFSADAAHELKTPLTILQGRIELALRRATDPALQADLADMQEEVGRLAAITRKLLLLSQADAGHLALNRTRVDLTAMLGELAEDAAMLLDGDHVRVRIEAGLAVQGDVVLLGQLFNNLVSNAARYRTPGGAVSLEARRTAGGIEAIFSNPCSPIPAAARASLFHRFRRLDPARGRSSEGSGLGLSIAREIARAHGGDVTLAPTAEDVVTLVVRLPAA